MQTDFYKDFSELDTDELKKVFENNRKLREEVLEDYQDQIMFWVGEYIDTLQPGLKNWDIGWYNNNYITVKNSDDFLEAVEELQKNFELLYKQDEPGYYPALTSEIKRKISRRDNMTTWRGTEALQDIIDKDIQELSDGVLAALNREFDVKEEYILDHFLDFWSEERAPENLYINSDYQLFQNVQYIKSYI